ncbi:MAG: DNA mismatch repair endonuclease MutL, partial [Candidatus Brocadiia bacterium]|nr:DNA mismatch repair endonuclease MutL [Candidatus Brocadiia bacterium]
MSSIRILPEDVSNLIAAGEVIERPASVVKELVENSLDAGASEINIEVTAGGVDKLRVADNGLGIARDEIELAFQRFATSKLAETSDLETISSLGFRGEALPSVAAVSQVTLVTKTIDEETGTRIEVLDGEVVDTRPEGAGPGTVVTVRRLFRDFPARRKFLRSATAEASRVQTLTTRFALAYPGVRFQLTIDGSAAFSTLGTGDLREVVSDLYGPGVAHSMLELVTESSGEVEEGPIAAGMIGPPSVTRSNRSHITIFVNGRWVQNRMLTYAVQEAYRGFLMERRFPVAVVSIAMPHPEVDVNVHPSKTEVRFRREGPVFSALQRAVRSRLSQHSPVPELRQPPVAQGPAALRTHGAPFAPRSVDASETPGLASWPAPGPGTAHSPPERAAEATSPETMLPRTALPALRVLGQVQNTYIAAEGPDGVYLIDQHAAHERVLFERVMAGAESRPPLVQGLMETVTVEMDPRQSELAGS